MTAAELHAAVNDAAPALLVASALFDLGGLALQRASLRTAGYWALWAGLIGVVLAVVSGLVAAGRIDHGQAIHAGMGAHRTLAYVAAGWWTVLGGWRLARPHATAAYVALALGGAGAVLVAAHRGGHLVFRLGAGIPAAVHRDALADIAGGHEHAPGEEHEHSGDTGLARDTAVSGDTMPAAHDHPPDTPAHQH